MIKWAKKLIIKSIINDLLKDLPAYRDKVLELLKVKEELVISNVKQSIKAKLVEISEIL